MARRDPKPQFLTVTEIAAELGLTRQAVSRIAAVMRIEPALVAGRTRLYRREDLVRFRERPKPGRPRTRS